MKRTIVYFALMILIVPVYASSDFVTGSIADQYLPFRVLDCQSSNGGLTLSLQLNSMSWKTSESSNSEIQYLELAGAGQWAEEGYPIVPIAGRLFRIPPTSGVRVELIEADYETVSEVDYATFYGELDDENLVSNLSPSDEWFPENLVEVSEPAIMHDFRVCNLRTYPVQVNTARREVRVYNNLQVRITFEGEDLRNALDEVPHEISETYLPWYRTFLDWHEDELDNYRLYRGHIQLVISNDEVIMETIEPWITWKKQKGWIIDLLTEDDVPNFQLNQIAEELRNRYENSETKFDYVVLVGSTADYHESSNEHTYACMAGNDDLIDVGVGRFYFRNIAALRNYVNKVLVYERDFDRDNTDWYNNALVTVSVSYGISGVFLGRYIKHALFDIGYTQVDTAWCAPYGADNVDVVSATSINNGVSFYSCRGRGVSLNQLDNGDMLPFAMVATCGSISGSIALTEAGTIANPKGTIGASGIGGYDTQVRFNVCLEYGGGFSMLVLRNRELGQLYYGSHINLWNNYERFDPQISYYYENFDLAGDPTVWVWTDTPQELDVEVPDNIQLGDNSHSFTVYQDDQPVSNAWVTLYKSDDLEEVIGRGVTDQNGEVYLDAPFRNTGNALLTVTMQNCAPFQDNIQVVGVEEYVGYTDIVVLDDGTNGTEGNGNGIAEAGETIGIQVEAHNYGNELQTDLHATISSVDNWINILAEEIEFPNITAGQSRLGDDMALCEISPAAQNNWEIPLTIDFNSNLGNYSDDFHLLVQAPEIIIAEIENLRQLAPGTDANIQIRLQNVGGSDSDAGNISLSCQDNFLGILPQDITIESIEVGDFGLTSEIQVFGHANCVPGYTALAELIINTNSGQVDTTIVPIPIGQKHSNDPSGPDSYGYCAFEDTDLGYEYTPVFDWIEISLDENDRDYNGNNCVINDNQDDDDEAICIDTPFPITFYGVEFNEVTLTANGMMAMGRQDDRGNSRNFIIPSPGGPNYMIAPYWDERFIGNNGGVYTYYDEENGRFIIEWYQVTDHQNSHPCTFEVIFYSLGHYPTNSNNNVFMFQYLDLTHTRGQEWNTSADVYYWTTGIENGNQTDGLLINYFNTSYPGASLVENGRAIAFSADLQLMVGSLEGTVTDLETELPIEGAVIHTQSYNYADTTDANGHYLISEIVIGENEIFIDRIGYNSQSSVEMIIENETTFSNYSLTHPEFECNRDSLFIKMNPDTEQTKVVSITNQGNGPLDYTFDIYFSENPEENIETSDIDHELDTYGNFVMGFDLTQEESRNRGIAFLEDNFWVCGSNNTNAADPNLIYQYDKNGDYLNQYEQPQTNNSALGFYDMSSDDNYLFGADRGSIYQMQFNNGVIEIINTIDSPYNIVKNITYDAENEVVWVTDTDEPIVAVNLDGDILTEIDHDLNIQGMDSFIDQDGDFYFIILNELNDDSFQICKMNSITGEISEILPIPQYSEGFTPIQIELSNRYNPLLWAIITVLDGGDQDRVEVHEFNLNTDWIDITPDVSTVQAGETADIDVCIYSEYLPLGFYDVWLNISHNSIEQNLQIPLKIEVTDEILGMGDFNFEQPSDWKFNGVYPNPFNPSMTVSFTLKEAVKVKTRIFNLMGQEVATITDQYFSAGTHNINYLADNLATGMYFLNLDAGKLQHTEKILLMK